ncbi:MAG: tRNA glutamyl-Q(34) synthetase GluQRS [Planctomycetes bacterium]|nr:tRNA glutamyl-Q(34) synthetase GluQRS [Planctomycetota bacterium]
MAAASTGRLAPSPTGHLHLGHARSFLLAWWHARSRAGRIVLRLEDLDVERVKPGSIEDTRADLEWLGLDWDGELWLQSEHAAAFDEAVASLLARGLAYACVCTRKEIAQAQSAPHESVALAEKSRYPGTCRGRYASLEDARRASGRDPAVRLLVEPGVLELHDEFAGPFSVDVAAQTGDFPIARRAGAVAYQLAVVIDDARQGVSEVVRGDDLLPSAARQYLVQRALGLPHPRWWHVPLVTDAQGVRLAKRTDALSLAQLRARGVDPRALIAWVARCSGMDAREPASARELLPHFDMRKLPRDPVRIDAGALVELGG